VVLSSGVAMAIGLKFGRSSKEENPHKNKKRNEKAF